MHAIYVLYITYDNRSINPSPKPLNQPTTDLGDGTSPPLAPVRLARHTHAASRNQFCVKRDTALKKTNSLRRVGTVRGTHMHRLFCFLMHKKQIRTRPYEHTMIYSITIIDG
jgi:hypothetical protein